jgi:hypothetical protein
MINRANYEEFFLLYVDNELSASERKAVEDFIAQNPDLAMELKSLEQSIIMPEENLFFAHKDSLYKKTEDSKITLSNYEPYFIQYIDNELDKETRIEVEKFVQENPQVQEEFSLYTQTKLVPDTTLIFKEKEILHKKEDRRKPIPFVWWSAAAVVLLLITGFLFYTNGNRQIDKPNGSIVSTDETKHNNDSISIKNKKEALAVTQPIVDTFHKKEENKNSVVANNNKPTKELLVKIKGPDTKNKDITPAPLLNNGNEKNIEPTLTAQTKSSNEKTITKDNNLPKPLIDSSKQVATVQKPKEASSTANTSNSTITTLVALNDNNVEYIHIANTSVKKNSLRGLFRKVSRVIEKATNSDDDFKRSVAVGNVKIPL